MIIIKPDVFHDKWEYFMETYHAAKFAEIGIHDHFVPDNHSRPHREARAFMRKLRPEYVVNAAAYTMVDRAETDQACAQMINGAVPGVLAEELRQGRGKLIIHYSTDYVFNGRQSPIQRRRSDRPYQCLRRE